MSERRILLVDDDESIRRIATRALESAGGYRLLALPSGREALAEVLRLAPELLILDVNMPDLDGPATLAALRRLGGPLRDVPAIFLTGRTLAREVAQLRALGAVDVIAKPFEPKYLIERVAQAFAPKPAGPVPQDARPAALLVEDDAGIAYLIRFILEREGWRVVGASDGRAGLQAIEQGEVTGLVLLDIMLPQVDGLALLERLRALPRWQGVPVMMLTGRGDEASVSRALAAGADEYLGKPFDPADLVARLQRMVGNRR